MRVQTKAFGTVEIDDRQVIRFTRGVFGFETLQAYALLDAKEPPFYWLQSLDDVQTAFVLVNPYVIRPDYVLNVSEADLNELRNPSEEDVLVFAIVTIPRGDVRGMTANLQGPIVVNRSERLAKQCISLDPLWTTKHGILEELGAGT